MAWLRLARWPSGALRQAELLGRERHRIAADPPDLGHILAVLLDQARQARILRIAEAGDLDQIEAPVGAGGLAPRLQEGRLEAEGGQCRFERAAADFAAGLDDQQRTV